MSEAAAPPKLRPRVASIGTRLALAVALILSGGGVVVTFAALAYGRDAAHEAFDRLLVGAANQIAGAIRIQGGEVIVDIPVSAFELMALAPEDRVAWRVVGPGGVTLTGYDEVGRPARATADTVFYNGEFRGERARYVSVRRRFAERAFSGTVDVIVGHTMRARDALAWDITSKALLVLGLAGVLMVGLAVFAIRSALAPLRRIEAALSWRDPHDLTPLEVDLPRETAIIVTAINRFMARLNDQMQGQRRLIADASHQLRTPVAALRAQAELAAEEEDPARLRAILARIRDRAVGLSRLTSQLLNHALIIHRAEAEPAGLIDLRTVAIRTAEESDHELFSSGADLALDVPEDPVWVRGDALSLTEACKNLVNNAFRHGSPPVVLRVAAAQGGRVRIGVRDRGAGPPEDHWRDAGARFSRTAGVTPDGAGLGLAIVHAVAKAHSGRLVFEAGARGGFEAGLDLPAAAGPAGEAEP
ncbi:sensor histidine kinase [Oceanicella sp. SM1341]|uniref:sensor histidine kinase n=1 Tax=Oceanicella sp. SM1341 TaxID=1548889 RepID=UPI0018E541FA|nr:sensor histidine kinase [Oceanicella sp. SM1341]